MKTTLSKQQNKILNFLRSYIKQFGYSPSEREIAQKLNIKWIRAAQKHLQALEKKGYIKREPGIKRGIKLADVSMGIETPILGQIAAGVPLLAEQNIEGSLLLDTSFSKGGPTFLLKVKGMSMKDAGIHDGDLVLVKQQPKAEQGDIVAAMINDEATVKYFKKRKDTISLEPANSEFDPIIVKSTDQFSIIGKIIASLRIIDGDFLKTIYLKP